MGLRDRFFTAATARAILSWRLLLGAVGAVIAGVAGAPVVAAAAIGVGVYASAVAMAIPKGPPRVHIDPFTVGEPWRQLVQGAQRSRQRLAAIVAATPAGPMRDELDDIVVRLDRGLTEGWDTARRGYEIDGAVSRLDSTALRARLTTLQARSAANPSDDLTAAMASVEAQLATADRLKQLSAATADRLRLSQARLDELVARAAEVTVGAGTTDAFAREVDELVIVLESLHQGVLEVNKVDSVDRAEQPDTDVDRRELGPAVDGEPGTGGAA